ncbi:MAG: trypsin-like peptidase domain-containing protein [Candidatus Omnitrophica bacterium]|nr:trypsin-like peptidase domain-containing protein [Candidatus Omnitrophota bacterium]
MKKIYLTVMMCLVCLCCLSFVYANDVAGLQASFNSVAQRIYPTVVSITTVHIERVAGEMYYVPFEDTLFDDFLGELFGYSHPTDKAYRTPALEKRHVGIGSGIIVHKDGFILTNYHLVENAEKNRVTVMLTDGKEREGIIVGVDTKYDLAVIKIDERDLPYAELANSDDIKVGDWAIAIGNPYGFVFEDAQPTMTVGVVSALNRTLPVLMRYGRSYSNLIQTDASINLGNSGGPLVNIEGKVIGINVAIVSTTGGNQGIGFAIPSNHCRDVLAQFVEGKKIAYGWLGVEAQNINDDLAKYFGVHIDHGVVVMNTLKNSPAFKAGLKEGDILVSFDGKKIINIESLLIFLETAKPGTQAQIGYIRGKRNASVYVVIEPRTQVPVDVTDVEAYYWRGAKPEVISPLLIEEYNLRNRSGLVITNILPASSAAEAGLVEGDVVLKMNDKKIDSLDDFFSFKDFNEDVLIKTNRGYFVLKRES